MVIEYVITTVTYTFLLFGFGPVSMWSFTVPFQIIGTIEAPFTYFTHIKSIIINYIVSMKTSVNFESMFTFVSFLPKPKKNWPATLAEIHAFEI